MKDKKVYDEVTERQESIPVRYHKRKRKHTSQRCSRDNSVQKDEDATEKEKKTSTTRFVRHFETLKC